MTAINQFFNHHREVSANREAFYKMMDEKEDNLQIEVINTDLFDDSVRYFDKMLMRNWFVDDESIHDLLMDADEDVFREIVIRVNKYSYNVRQVILSFFPITDRKLKLKIRDITDTELELCEVRQLAMDKQSRDIKWETYVTENRLEAPIGELDEDYDEMLNVLELLKTELSDAKRKTLVGRYVPPAMRDSILDVDPMVMRVTKKIVTVENEIILQKKLIKQENDDWFRRQRDTFEQTMLAL